MKDRCLKRFHGDHVASLLAAYVSARRRPVTIERRRVFQVQALFQRSWRFLAEVRGHPFAKHVSQRHLGNKAALCCTLQPFFVRLWPYRRGCFCLSVSVRSETGSGGHVNGLVTFRRLECSFGSSSALEIPAVWLIQCE